MKPCRLLTEIWQLYCRRFGIDHWFRFALATAALDAAQPGHGQTSRTLEQLDALAQERNCDLLVNLWLTVRCPGKNLPWQKPQIHLTPGRVSQSISALFMQLGTPAQIPKLGGKSPGWTKGQPRTPRVRAPIVKKRYFKRRKPAQTPA